MPTQDCPAAITKQQAETAMAGPALGLLTPTAGGLPTPGNLRVLARLLKQCIPPTAVPARSMITEYVIELMLRFPILG
jgi:hypothetical protein